MTTRPDYDLASLKSHKGIPGQYTVFDRTRGERVIVWRADWASDFIEIAHAGASVDIVEADGSEHPSKAWVREQDRIKRDCYFTDADPPARLQVEGSHEFSLANQSPEVAGSVAPKRRGPRRFQW